MIFWIFYILLGLALLAMLVVLIVTGIREGMFHRVDQVEEVKQDREELVVTGA